MRALSIRQPFAELILQGIKTVEYRSRPTRVIGERFYIYAARKWAAKGIALPGATTGEALVPKSTVWSNELAAAQPPPWMLELAEALRLWGPTPNLPTGVIVGTAIIARCTPAPALLDPAAGETAGWWHWHLADIRKLANPRKPNGRPQPVWFNN